MSWQEEYMQRFYLSRPRWRGGTEEFWELIRSHVPPQSEVLELGCGPANPTSQFLSESFVCVDGLDVDDTCRRNRHLRCAYVYDGGCFPIQDAAYDAVVCNYVLEHVENPTQTVREVRRVLRSGGMFVFRTPNRWHYVPLISRLTPHWFHERFANRLRNLSEEAEAPCPTFYRMNSLSTIGKLLTAEGFERLEMRTIEKEPSYGMSVRVLFLLFMLYERIANSAEELSVMRSNILGAFRKPPR